MSNPQLPTKFPCWVQAVYSWGGETKKDLGFIEGDLIECLNAGDGSWWVGRLKRDRRMVGAFPSNFVKVLGEDFQPKSRKASPLPHNASVSSPDGRKLSNSTPQKKNTYLRKAFSSYANAGSPNPLAAARELEEKAKSGTPTPPGSTRKRSTPKPYSSMHKPMNSAPSLSKDTFRPPSPKIPQPIARASVDRSSKDFGNRSRPSSPPSRISRAASPAPPPRLSTSEDRFRSSSPAPYFASDSGYHTASQESQQAEDEDDAPPPPPPAHRYAYSRHNTPSPHQQQRYGSGPSPAGSGHSGMTPSPLREAMNEVMSSLDDMGMPSDELPPVQDRPPPDPWSPEAFGEVYNTPSRRARPQTELGYRSKHFEDEDDDRDAENLPYNPYGSVGNHRAGASVQNYVQRMESRLQNMDARGRPEDDADEEDDETRRDAAQEYFSPDDIGSSPPPLPAKNSPLPQRQESTSTYSRPPSSSGHRPQSSLGNAVREFSRSTSLRRSLKHRKSAYEMGDKEKLDRNPTVKSSVTSATNTSSNHSHATQSTDHTLMSGFSAGGFSATSAGSYARRQLSRRQSNASHRPMTAMELQRPGTAMSGVSYHDSHSSGYPGRDVDKGEAPTNGILGGLSEPSAKKRGFFKKLGDKMKTSTATARSTVSGNSRPSSPTKGKIPDGITSIAGGLARRSSNTDAARELGLGSGPSAGVDWVQMRRDVNRSNTLSRNERNDRLERCQMMDLPVICPVDDLNTMADGNEGIDGSPVDESTDFQSLNFTMVDKSARFVTNLPATLNAASLAQGYVCRPHRSDLQKLRAIFIWVSERISWEEDFEGDVDPRRVIQSRRGCAKEVALLVAEMCGGVGIHADMVRGYLKSPQEPTVGQDLNDIAAHPNHWWNAVLVEGEWRMMDCSLAAPSNPRRALYSSASNQAADSWWFLAKPLDICYTHVPLLPEHQHIVPSLQHETLMALPLACPSFFKHGMQMCDFDTSLLFLEGLEMAQIHLSVPEDVECVAEVEARSFAHDADGDRFESGEVIVKRALAQADFIATTPNPSQLFKRVTIKAVLPSLPHSASQATLKVYAGKRGLMHAITSNPHGLALCLPLLHEGTNPEYDFFLRHPTPHALRNELYVVGPQCKRLAINNTFVFGVRQHVAASKPSSTAPRPASPNPGMRPPSALSIARPGSALSMTSASASGSAYSHPSNSSADSGAARDDRATKPAKLAIQSPSGKILRMNRKLDHAGRDAGDDGWRSVGSAWETIIKIGERGTWRGLVLADRTARWCVFGEWECV